MLKINPAGKKRKAQHLVELALLLPIFVFAFSYFFQVMTETFVQSKFSYAFESAIKEAIKTQPVYHSMDERNDDTANNIKETAYTLFKRNLGAALDNYSDLSFSYIEGDLMTYIVGSFKLFRMRTLLFSHGGNLYLNFIIPVSSAYLEPMVLDMDTDFLDELHTAYYEAFVRNIVNEGRR